MYTLFYPEIINAKLFNRTEAVSLAWPWGLGFPDLIKFRYVFGLQTLRLNVIAAHVLTGKIPQVKQLLSFVKRKQGFLFVIDLDVSGNATRKTSLAHAVKRRDFHCQVSPSSCRFQKRNPSPHPCGGCTSPAFNFSLRINVHIVGEPYQPVPGKTVISYGSERQLEKFN